MHASDTQKHQLDEETFLSIRSPDWLVAAVFATCFLALFLLRSQVSDLQGDETWTRLLVRLPLSESWSFLVRDGKHPPLFPMVTRALGLLLPDRPSALRVVSLLAASSMPPSVYLFARRWAAPRWPSAAIAIWVGMHPLVSLHAVNARPYALLTFLVMLHAALIADFLLLHKPKSLWASGAVASAAVITHAFGVLFVLSSTFIAMMWVVARRQKGEPVPVAAMARSQAPALGLCIAWFAFVQFSLRHSTGISAGLDWVEFPTTFERFFGFVTLLGSADFPRSTTLTAAVWLLVVACVVGLRKRPSSQLVLIALTFVCIFAPFIAQNLVSGLIAKMPLWGNRHVLPTVGLLAIGSVIAIRDSKSSRLATAVFVAFAALAVGSLSTVSLWRRTAMSDIAGAYDVLPRGMEIRVAYEYGDLNVLNYYLSVDCLDDYQFRVQFPDLKGPADPSVRGPQCIAKPFGVRTGAGGPLLMVYRSFVPREVGLRDSVAASGWRSSGRHDFVTEKIVAEFFLPPTKP